MSDLGTGCGQGAATPGVVAPARVLLVHRGKGPEAYPGVVAGWRALEAEGVIGEFHHHAVDTARPVDPRQLWANIEETVIRHELDTVVLHHFHSPSLGDPRPGLERLRSVRPDVFVAVSNGDAFMNGYFGRPSPPKMLLQAAEMADLVFSTSMGAIGDLFAERTSCPVVLMPLGVHPPRFRTTTSPMGHFPPADVVFIGSNNRPRNVARSYHWFARRRERLVRRLSDRFGERFAVFGFGWEGVPGWRGPAAFDDQWIAARSGKVVVGGVPYSQNRYYLSNRPFIQIASGVPFVDVKVDGVDLMLRDGEHWRLVDDDESLADVCEAVLAEPSGEREERAGAAAQFVLQHHTESARVGSQLRTVLALKGVRSGLSPGGKPDLAALLPEVDLCQELPLATRNWPGLTSP